MPIIVGEGGPRDRERLALATKRGRDIPNVRRRPRPPNSMVEAATLATMAHPTVQIRSRSSEYNCMGLVFASRRTWIDSGELSRILGEDGFKQITPASAQPGDVLVYRDQIGESVHVGWVYSHEAQPAAATWKTTVLSQWGGDGEYFHEAEDVNPLLGKPAEYWTDRL
ncbi:MAG: hypothetical protein ACRD2N_10300 [Vicinamibacterales bacterium]